MSHYFSGPGQKHNSFLSCSSLAKVSLSVYKLYFLVNFLCGHNSQESLWSELNNANVPFGQGYGSGHHVCKSRQTLNQVNSRYLKEWIQWCRSPVDKLSIYINIYVEEWEIVLNLEWFRDGFINKHRIGCMAPVRKKKIMRCCGKWISKTSMMYIKEWDLDRKIK